jgi:hypothetical protein
MIDTYNIYGFLVQLADMFTVYVEYMLYTTVYSV